jgi:hypothetical protein
MSAHNSLVIKYSLSVTFSPTRERKREYAPTSPDDEAVDLGGGLARPSVLLVLASAVVAATEAEVALVRIGV